MLSVTNARFCCERAYPAIVCRFESISGIAILGCTQSLPAELVYRTIPINQKMAHRRADECSAVGRVALLRVFNYGYGLRVGRPLLVSLPLRKLLLAVA